MKSRHLYNVHKPYLLYNSRIFRYNPAIVLRF